MTQPSGEQVDTWADELSAQMHAGAAWVEIRVGPYDLRSYRPHGPIRARLAKRLLARGWAMQSMTAAGLNDGTGFLITIAAYEAAVGVSQR